MKRGFPTKREALEWERAFLQQKTADLDMTFENFVAVYVADMKGRIKENTWGTKDISFTRSWCRTSANRGCATFIPKRSWRGRMKCLTTGMKRASPIPLCT